MARLNRRLAGPRLIDQTTEVVFTNTAGQVTTVACVIIAQPASAIATVVRLTVGGDAAATRWFEYPVPAGAGTYMFYPGLIVTGVETIEASSTVTDDVAVLTLVGSSEHAITL